MVRLTTDRTELDAALGNDRFTLLIVAGDSADANAIEALAEEKVTQPWRFVFLVTDLALLTAAETSAWVDDVDQYCVLGGDAPKAVAEFDTIDALQRTDGRPSILRIRRAFAKGDQL